MQTISQTRVHVQHHCNNNVVPFPYVEISLSTGTIRLTTHNEPSLDYTPSPGTTAASVTWHVTASSVAINCM